MLNTTEQPVIRLEDSKRTRCEVWTRVMGYHRPISEFNPGKRGEFNERLAYAERPADGSVI